MSRIEDLMPRGLPIGAIVARANTVPEVGLEAWQRGPEAQRALFHIRRASFVDFANRLKPETGTH